MEIRFTPKAEDYTALASYWTRYQNSLLGIQRRWGVLALLILLAGLFLFLYLIGSSIFATSLFWMLASVGTVVAVLLFLLRVVWLRLMVKRLSGEMTVAFTPEGLRHGNAKVQSLTDWTAIEHVGLTSDHLFFMFSKNRGVAVPRQAFASSEDFRAALDTLRHYLPDLDIGTAEQG